MPEKMPEQLKTVYVVMPVMFKSVPRIEAFLFTCFTTMLIQALIERQVRVSMKKREIASLTERECISPTARKLLSAFSEVITHHLLEREGNIDVFETKLNDKQKLLLTPLDKFEDITFQNCGKQY